MKLPDYEINSRWESSLQSLLLKVPQLGPFATEKEKIKIISKFKEWD